MTDCATEYARELYSRCAVMISETEGAPDPKWGWRAAAVSALLVFLLADIIYSHYRKDQTRDRHHARTTR